MLLLPAAALVASPLPRGCCLEDMLAMANRCPPGRMLDLEGKVLEAAAAADDTPLTLSPCNHVTIHNGTIHLARRQQLLVRGPHAVRLEGVTLLGPGAMAAGHTHNWLAVKGLVQVAGAGGSLHLAGCTLWGGAHDAVLVADEGGHLEMSGACVVSGHPGGWGCIVRGEGSHMEAEGATLRDHAWSALLVGGGGTATLIGCQLSGSKVGHGLHVESCSRAVVRRCVMSGNGDAGVYVRGLGGSVELTGCQMTGDAHGLHVCGPGSLAIARECSVAGCAGYGVHVLDHGCAEMTGCSADSNGGGSFHLAAGSVSSSRLVLAGCTWPPSQPPSPAALVR